MDGREFIRKAVEDLEKNGYRPANMVMPTNNKGKKDTMASAATTATKSTAESKPETTEPTAEASTSSPAFKTFDHFVMNLPATAIEFLDAFRGLFKGREAQITQPKVQLPMIHCHCFSKSETPEDDVRERVESVMGGKLERDSVHLHWVRKVAPNKDMYCISFRLPAEIAFAR